MLTRLYRNWSFRLLAVGLMLGIAFGLDLATVASAADPTTPPNATSVDLGAILGVAMPYIAALVAGLVSVICTDLWLFAKKKWGIDIDAAQRDALQTALTNGAGLLIAKGAHLADGKTIDVKNPVIKQGVDYVVAAVPGALAHYGLGPQDVADKLVAKIGALTAPTAPPAAPAAAPAPAAG